MPFMLGSFTNGLFGGASDVFSIANQWENLKQNRIRTQEAQVHQKAGQQVAAAMGSQSASDGSAPNPAVTATGGAPGSAGSTGTSSTRAGDAAILDKWGAYKGRGATGTSSTGQPSGTSGGRGTPGFDLSGTVPTPKFMQTKGALPTGQYLANDGYGTGLGAPGSPAADAMQPALPPRAAGQPGQTSVQNSAALPPTPTPMTPAQAKAAKAQTAANRAGLEQVYGTNAATASGAVARAIPAVIDAVGRGIRDTAVGAAQGAGYGAGLPDNMVAPPPQASPAQAINTALPTPRTAAPQYLPSGAVPGVTVSPSSPYAQPAVGAYPAPSSMGTPTTNPAMPSLAGGQVGLGGMILRALNPTGAP